MNKTDYKNNAIESIDTIAKMPFTNAGYVMISTILSGIIFAILYLAEVIKDKK